MSVKSIACLRSMDLMMITTPHGTFRNKASCLTWFLFIISIVITQPLLAQNFTISPAPGYPVPSTVYSGGLTSAYYTVTNNTQSPRYGYTLQGVPNGVKQNDNATNCSIPINLEPQGRCVLQLDITQAVHSNFALCKGMS